ncbi:cytochrome b [Alteromonas oceanisediminis]|uniref:cytochrome b n=1 Tax=Alteromonas oceanisediminis TaxID=2836180 RepID=UPI001BDA902C|nr:cytochrome b [Alteromonas oceanisediminis]MBT0587818.1 cytochrome b [Alteromonas oceanisediminis]
MAARYHSVSIALHWLIALALLFMFASGLFMVNVDMSKADQYKLFQIHKSAGVLVLLSIALRLIVRWITSQPRLPDAMTHQEKRLAKWGHWALYAAMIVMPLSGWLMVSASPFGLPTIVFDWFEWPHIPGVERNKTIESIAREIHWYTGLTFLSLMILHIAAVIKHRVKDNLNLLPRMWWRTHIKEKP